ncbi:Hypothetical predicted protein [Octopus vulgaris]|uniref:Uncharacterized protein n=1 Tax=Octopus vulgaris TaxID=6645 RepID=A0AA36BHI4_OCTVU|nr:Hypothetical predicted protein [Octopus vulgaris]
MDNSSMNGTDSRDEKNYHNLKTYKNPSSNPALAKFEHDLMNLITRLKFSKYTNPFQRLLSNKISAMKSSPGFHVLSDKT